MTSRRGRVGQAEGLEQLVGPGLGLGAAQAQQAGQQDQVLASGEVLVDRGQLPGEAHQPAHRVALGHDVVAQHAGLSGVRPQQRGQHADRRGLARAVGAEHAVDRAGAHRQVHAVHRPGVAEGLDQAGGLDRECGSGHGPHARPMTSRVRCGLYLQNHDHRTRQRDNRNEHRPAQVARALRPLRRDAHDRARRHDRERGPAVDPGRPGLLAEQPRLGGERVPDRLRRPAAAGRPDRRPDRTAPGVPDRPGRIHRRVAGVRHRPEPGRADRRRGSSRAPAARSRPR